MGTMDSGSRLSISSTMDPELPIDLRFAIASISERYNACRLVSLSDVNDELPTRDLSRTEVERVLQSLAAHGIHVIEDDAVDHLAT